MTLTELDGTRIGVLPLPHAAAGARLKRGFQAALDAEALAVVVVPEARLADSEHIAELSRPVTEGRADVVTDGASRAFATAFLARVPFWESTDDAHFDAQLLLQAAQARARIVERAPRLDPGSALGRFRARTRYLLHRNGILYSRYYDLAIGGRKYFEKFDDPASSHTLIWQWLLRHGVGGKEVLELGVGDASLTRRLSEAGAVVDGIELDAVAAELARPYCRSIVVDDLDDLRSARIEKRYDLIIAADVLEHLRDPERVLSELRELVRPDGRLVVSLPNVGNLYVRLNVLLGRFPYHTKGILDRTHLHFYTLRSAERMFVKTGWSVVERGVTAVPLAIVFPFLRKPVFAPLMALFRSASRMWKGAAAYQGLFYVEVDRGEPSSVSREPHY